MTEKLRLTEDFDAHVVLELLATKSVFLLPLIPTNLGFDVTTVYSLIQCPPASKSGLSLFLCSKFFLSRNDDQIN